MGVERMYVIRRTDGEPLFGEWSFSLVDGPDDWQAAIEDARDSFSTATYELLEMVVTRIHTRTLPECVERSCLEPGEYWGMCEQHAREDDEEALEEILSKRIVEREE